MLPGLPVEERDDLATALAAGSGFGPETLTVVDCLNLWLVQRLMPLQGNGVADVEAEIAALLHAVGQAPGPLVLVGQEIGSGLIGATAEVRRYVDAFGRLQQSLAAACDRVTLMVAGCELVLKGGTR
jgi:adenosylcobinamide kinase/adenosylcobinamide-phosphate guanylyltransferase